MTSPRHPQLTSGLVTFSVQSATPPQVVAHLWRKGRVVSRWVENPSGVRLSLHFFNTEEEIQTVVDCLRDLG